MYCHKCFQVILIISLVLFSCAKDRSVEKKVDLSGKRHPKSIFLSEHPWFFKATVVKRSEMIDKLFVGLNSNSNINALKMGYFDFTQEKLFFKSSISSYVSETEALKQVINSWDVKHSEYMLAESNGKVSNKEIDAGDSISWKRKDYFSIDFSNSDFSPSTFIRGWSNNDCWSLESKNLVPDSKEVGSDYLGYVVEYHFAYNARDKYRYKCLAPERLARDEWTATVQIRYSYMKALPRKYEPYVYNGQYDELRDKYGYFTTDLHTFNEKKVRKITTFMNRLDPNKEHDFYLAPGFPEKFKSLVTDPDIGIFAITNKIFKKHGLKTRINIKENDGSKKYGDIRYSFIKADMEHSNGSPGGIASINGNPLTGEIISGTVTVFPSVYEALLEDYVLKKAALRTKDLASSDLMQNIQEIMKDKIAKDDGAGQSMGAWIDTADMLDAGTTSGDIFRFITTNNNTYSFYENYTLSRKEIDLAETNRQISKLDDIRSIFQGADWIDDLKGVIKDVEKENMAYRHGIDGTEYVTSMITQLGADGRSPDDILQTLMFNLITHELGHVLGLRHNFYGSVDKPNFMAPAKYKGVDGKIREYAPNTSSVMDYIPITAEIHVGRAWGPYDEAALAYGYSDGKVDLSTREGRKHLKDKEPVTFMYCTDEHVPHNPMCNRSDRGVTPSEIVLNEIINYDTNFWMSNFRDYRKLWSSELYYPGRMYRLMRSLAKFIGFDQEAFTSVGSIKKSLSKKEYTSEEIGKAYDEIDADKKRALKLVIAFYNAVLTLDNNTRPFKDYYNYQGDLEYIGTYWDKVWASYYLWSIFGHSIENQGQFLKSFLYYYNKETPELKLAMEKASFNSLADPYAVVGYSNFPEMRQIFFLAAVTDDSSSATSSPEILANIEAKCYKESSVLIPQWITKSAMGMSPDKQKGYFKYDNKVFIADKTDNTFVYNLINTGMRRPDYKAEQLYELSKRVRILKTSSPTFDCE